ncbi:L-rhamnose-binding lectin SML-like [Stigmatopora argus]
MFRSFGLSSALLLTATWLLLTTVVESRFQVTTCELKNSAIHLLHCGNGVINVKQALYGRSSSAVCAVGASPQEVANTNCARPETLKYLKAICNGKKACELNLDHFQNPDPCIGTLKYLQTNYTCLPSVTVVVCENSESFLYCEEGQRIFILGADYGRRDRNKCSFKRAPHEMENTECTRPTNIVATECNNKDKCGIKANNALYGDPCKGIYKYLEVAYTCLYPGQHY